MPYKIYQGGSIMDKRFISFMTISLFVYCLIYGAAYYLHKTGIFPTYDEIGIKMNGEITKGPHKGKTITRALLGL